jgi:hypothetical protein
MAADDGTKLVGVGAYGAMQQQAKRGQPLTN